MGKDTPDLQGAAMAQNQLAKDAVNTQTLFNRPDQVTPWGTISWDRIRQPGRDAWRQTFELPEAQQRAIEAQQRIGAGRSELAESLLGRAQEELGAPVGWEALEANQIGTGAETRQRAEDALYGRATSRLDPYWEEERTRVEGQLFNQGLRPGDEAYDTAMGNFERAKTDAYQTAMNEAIRGGGVEATREFGMDMQRRQQAIAESLRRRNLALSEMNQATRGQQVGMPQMPTFRGAGTSGAPDLLGARLQEYNIQQAQDQGLMSGLMGLATGTAGLWGPGLMKALDLGSAGIGNMP